MANGSYIASHLSESQILASPLGGCGYRRYRQQKGLPFARALLDAVEVPFLPCFGAEDLMPTELIDLPQARSCHDVESDVRRELLSTDGVKLSSLVVRRMQNGICLQGVVKFSDESFDICDAVRKIPGVNRILNHLVVCGADEKPADAGALTDSQYTVSWEKQR